MYVLALDMYLDYKVPVISILVVMVMNVGMVHGKKNFLLLILMSADFVIRYRGCVGVIPQNMNENGQVLTEILHF